ncbi:uncharacterized protein PAC_08635 [Phialocephala subalpina]|uniref:Clr5 domain-containing protein n=1 Tax=Phialocephala subalpina TaxID=576137 RepID=A0A1L7X157_9HELO|nr:uncharacterized protein PAC_08635 [Phialocephala subalpina]
MEPIICGQQPQVRQAVGGRALHSEKKWEEMKPLIKEVFITNEPVRSLIKTMTQVYGFTASEWMYKDHFARWGWHKNRTKNNPAGSSLGAEVGGATPRRRNAKGLPHVEQKLTGKAFGCFTVTIPGLYLCTGQARMLSSIVQYVDGLFDLGNKNHWTFDTFRFYPPSSTQDDAEYWQRLSDRCYSASSSLVRMRSKRQFDAKIPDFFQQLTSLPGTNILSPHIMAIFWQICLTLRGMCSKGRGGNLVRKFLRSLKAAIITKSGLEHPVVKIIDSIHEATPHDFRKKSSNEFKYLLSVGYERTLTRLEEVIGKGHAIVLHMWSRYLRYWDRTAVEPRSFLAAHLQLFIYAESSSDVQSSTSIAILLGYTYAAYYSDRECGLQAEMLSQSLPRRMDECKRRCFVGNEESAPQAPSSTDTAAPGMAGQISDVVKRPRQQEHGLRIKAGGQKKRMRPT